VPSSDGSSKRPAENERAPRTKFPELRLGISHAANDGSRQRGDGQLVCCFVERQLQATDVAPVNPFWLRRIAVMRDLSFAGGTFPRHNCTRWSRNSGAVLPAEFAVRWHGPCEGSSDDGSPAAVAAVSAVSSTDWCRRGREHREFSAVVYLPALRPLLVRCSPKATLAVTSPASRGRVDCARRAVRPALVRVNLMDLTSHSAG